MAKKRPRTGSRVPSPQAGADGASKFDAAYWERRLFKNTFTYQGRRKEVRGWSVKIQIFGRRKTFTVNSSDRKQAAVESSQIYQTILTQGWEAVGQRRARVGYSPHAAWATPGMGASADSDAEQWKSRLIHRKYPEPTESTTPRELSVRMDHQGISRYFPLGTVDEDKASARAMRIYATLIQEGWAATNQKFSRELTLAFRWLDDPLAWTYTTIHTWKNGNPIPRSESRGSRSRAHTVVIVEADEGIRLALEAYLSRQKGFTCGAHYASAAEALRETARKRFDLAVINFALPDQPGAACLDEMHRARPGLAGLLYSVFEDSDQLFKATPGGAAGYLLKRTSPFRIFEPIQDTKGALTRELIASRIREYFQRLVAAIPSGLAAREMNRLTSREHEILALLAKGDLAKEIANALGISVWTVHGHVKNIFEKLNVHTRTEAVVKFLQK